MEERRRTDLIVEELRRLKGQGRIVAAEQELRKFVVFTLGEGLYGFEGADVKEILPLLEIFPVPGAPQSVPGVVNNRGDIEAVVDLCAFLGLAAGERTASARIVMTERAGVRSGMLVDSVVDVVDLPAGSVEPPLETLADAVRELVSGATVYRGRIVVLLDAGRVIAALRAHGD